MKIYAAASQGDGCVWALELVMQILHTMVNDTIRVAFLKQFAANICLVLNAHNLSKLPLIEKEMIANLMNDQTFYPTSLVDPKLHDLFSEQIDLPKDTCMNVDVTAQQVKQDC